MSKIKIEIKHRYTGSILFEYESTKNTVKKTLEKAVSKGADLGGADLYGADLRGANLRGANLGDADLGDANLYDANLYGADLRGANLGDADLGDANLYDANLYGADLRGADLRGANLGDADLRGADLRGANLYGAKNVPSNQTNYYWHLHHQELYEWADEPIRARINYIKENKPKDEIELRLKLMKPVLGDIPSTEAGWKKLHKVECGCSYDFKKKTIFTKKNGLEKDVA